MMSAGSAFASDFLAGMFGTSPRASLEIKLSVKGLIKFSYEDHVSLGRTGQGPQPGSEIILKFCRKSYLTG